jgi:hypothetical protein
MKNIFRFGVRVVCAITFATTIKAISPAYCPYNYAWQKTFAK